MDSIDLVCKPAPSQYYIPNAGSSFNDSKRCPQYREHLEILEQRDMVSSWQHGDTPIWQRRQGAVSEWNCSCQIGRFDPRFLALFKPGEATDTLATYLSALYTDEGVDVWANYDQTVGLLISSGTAHCIECPDGAGKSCRSN
eukprot:3147900-Prymnesium_polylepis.1